MRVLKPEIAQDRKNRILNWVVYNYVSTGKPVSSDVIASRGGFKVSSATIRSILKELEDTGYLFQAHTSAGRIPSDKGYRAYVDNITRLQKLAAIEKERVEEEYERRVEELDGFLKATSRVIADLSHWAGFVMSADIRDDAIKRLDLISLGPRSILSVLFAHSGIIKHAAFSLETVFDRNSVRNLSSKLNKRLKDAPVADAAKIIWREFLHKGAWAAETGLLKKLLDYFNNLSRDSDLVYLEGLSRIYENLETGDMGNVREIARVLEEKDKFSRLLKERLKDCSAGNSALAVSGKRHAVNVTIGSENHIREFKNFSLVSSAYCMNARAVGLVGILGDKRMEYPKMISIVDSVSSMVEDMLSGWDKLELEN
ncbi:MAG: heat-inducible transcription repressor HrcA [Elusimicrobia bacterium]|nr:heat-inducible transcription repressor HrcA [Elusimicrobiota bacterium]